MNQAGRVVGTVKNVAKFTPTVQCMRSRENVSVVAHTVLYLHSTGLSSVVFREQKKEREKNNNFLNDCIDTV